MLYECSISAQLGRGFRADTIGRLRVPHPEPAPSAVEGPVFPKVGNSNYAWTVSVCGAATTCSLLSGKKMRTLGVPRGLISPPMCSSGTSCPG